MNLSGNKSRLMALTKELSLRWQDTRAHWRDARAEEFQRRFLQELFPRVNQAVTAMDKLDELFARIRKDCE